MIYSPGDFLLSARRAPQDAAGRLRLMPRLSDPASRGGECCRQGSADRSWRAPARCRSCGRSGRPPNSAALRTHARCERGCCSWRGSLAFAHPTADAFGTEATIEGLDEGVIGRLARPREVKGDAVLISP